MKMDNMQETGCLQEYLQYNISMEIEYNWINVFITEQFSKADSKCIRISELISSVSFVVSHYGRYQDYKKLLALKDIYLNGADLYELNFYFDNVLESIRSLLENNNIASNLKLEIVTKLENMVVETATIKLKKFLVSFNVYNYIVLNLKFTELVVNVDNYYAGTQTGVVKGTANANNIKATVNVIVSPNTATNHDGDGISQPKKRENLARCSMSFSVLLHSPEFSLLHLGQ